MSDSNHLEYTGIVLDSCKSIFKVKIDNEDRVVTCTLSGKLRINNIQVNVKDRVKVKVGVYDPSRGMITYRDK
jgi:translation initiation factor IF-1